MSVQTESRPAPLELNGNVPIPFEKTTWDIPPSSWSPKNHPRAEEVSREVDGYFLKHWKFPDDQARKKFLKAGFSRVTCLYFPLAKDDRIHFACRLLTVLFLIDGTLPSPPLLIRKSAG